MLKHLSYDDKSTNPWSRQYKQGNEARVFVMIEPIGNPSQVCKQSIENQPNHNPDPLGSRASAFVETCKAANYHVGYDKEEYVTQRSE
jgi:hypothetical protein